MARQLVLDLPVRPAMGREDFLVTGSNAVAVARIDAWRDWAFGKLVLVGPEGAGKTHLAQVWAGQAEAIVIQAADVTEADLPHFSAARAIALEGIETVAGDRAAETRLFHLHNALAGTGAPLLVTARRPASRWGLVLPDLASRLAQAEMVALDPPDEALLTALIVKLAHDRGLSLGPRLLAHVVPRLERSAATVAAFIDRLDTRALSQHRPPTLTDAREVLAELEAPVSPSRHID